MRTQSTALLQALDAQAALTPSQGQNGDTTLFAQAAARIRELEGPLQKPPVVKLELPDGDKRKAKAWFSEWKTGELYVCISVDHQRDGDESMRLLPVQLPQEVLDALHPLSPRPNDRGRRANLVAKQIVREDWARILSALQAYERGHLDDFETSPDLYYIQACHNEEHYARWRGKDGGDAVVHLADAARYTFEDAEAICRAASVRKWPCVVIDAIAKATVDVGDLPNPTRIA